MQLNKILLAVGSSFVYPYGLLRLDGLYIPTTIDFVGSYKIESKKIQFSSYSRLLNYSLVAKSWETFLVLAAYFEHYKLNSLKEENKGRIDYKQFYLSLGLMTTW